MKKIVKTGFGVMFAMAFPTLTVLGTLPFLLRDSARVYYAYNKAQEIKERYNLQPQEPQYSQYDTEVNYNV